MRLAAALLTAALALSACGPGPDKINKRVETPPLAGPTYTTTGSLSAVALDSVTLDHEAVPEAGLAAGRTTFKAFADVLATAPEGSGARVTASFRKQGTDWALTELKARE